jgi:Domain of unknown function (DUF5606)
MDYSKIIAVTGMPGLYELVASKSDGAIVRSLDDKSTRFVSSRVHNFSHLESIEIYTVRDNVNLVDVLNGMDKNGGSLPDIKDNEAVKKYFQKAYPNMDFDRVYASDMKKMIKWFESLKKHNVEIKLSEPEEVVEEVPAPVQAKEENPKKATVAEDKPKAKTVAAKEKVAEEKPKKKATVKEEEEKPKKKAAAPKAKKEEKEEKAPAKKAAPKKK